MILTRILVAAGLSLSSLVGLSGCTSPVDSSTDDVVTAQGKLLPFAYDTSVDTIAHMSCSNMPATTASAINTSAYFTYRVGAYNQGGLTLSDTFYTQLKKYRSQMQSDILAASPANTNTVLQLALRSRSNYQTLYTKNSSTATANLDYYNMLSALGGSDVALTLVSNPAGGRVRFIRNGSAGGYRLEGNLIFTDSAAVTSGTRSFLSGTGADAGVIAVTYTNGGATLARSAADTVTGSTVNSAYSVFGRGYIPSFTQPTPSGSATAPSTSYPANVLSSMTEKTLDGSALATTPVWSCPTNLQMKIIRAADAAAGLTGATCNKRSDPSLASLSSDDQNRLTILRRTLRVEDWYIDLANNCIISKHTGGLDCYGNVPTVSYVIHDNCTTDSSTGFSNCAQFASSCFRTN